MVYLFDLLVRGQAVRMDPAVEVHLIRALGLLQGWDLWYRGPEAGPTGVYLGPLTYVLYALPLGAGTGLFGVLTLRCAALAGALYQLTVVVRRARPELPGGWATVAPALLFVTPFYDALATTLAHSSFLPLLATSFLLASQRALEPGGRRTGWLVTAAVMLGLMPQLHPVGLAFAPAFAYLLYSCRDLGHRALLAAGAACLFALSPIAIASMLAPPAHALGATSAALAEPGWSDTLVFTARMLGPGFPQRPLSAAAATRGLAALLLGFGLSVRAAARQPTPFRRLLVIQVAFGALAALALGIYAQKPQYLHALVWPLAAAAALGLPEQARRVPRAAVWVVIAAVIAVGALEAWRQPPAPRIPTALQVEAIGAELATRGVDITALETRVHGLSRDDAAGLRYGVLAQPAAQGTAVTNLHMALVPAGLELSPLAVGRIRSETLSDGTRLLAYAPIVDYNGVRAGDCAPAIPFSANHWAGDAKALFGLHAGPSLCPNAAAGPLALSIPLHPGPAGVLNLIVAPGGVAAAGIQATWGDQRLVVQREPLPPTWELAWFTVHVPARRSADKVTVTITTGDRLRLLDLF